MQRLLLALLATTLFTPLQAAPWVNPGDIHLRADLQRLADEGIITVPVNTFPLMWSGILADLKQVQSHTLEPATRDAVMRVRHRASMDTSEEGQIYLGVGAATDTPRFQHFGTPLREKGELTVAAEKLGDRFAGRLEVTYAHDSQDDEDLRLDGSYLSAVTGNWVWTAGMVESWWGPGWDTALTMSSNARPIPSFTLSRNNPQAFESKWLSWIGPWTLTTGVGLMNDDNRWVNDPLLWTFRATAKPIQQLEIGVSRAAQLCGDGRSCSLSTWLDMLTGDDNAVAEDGSADDQPGNQLASIDVRWGSTLYGLPYGLYWETMGEDNFSPGKFPPFSAKSYVYGADLSYTLWKHQIRNFFEYTNTAAKCGNGENNCAYEHHIFRSGYRFWQRSIGSTYDNDTESFTLGWVGFAPNGHQWKANLRYLNLNRDNDNKSPPGGNTAAPIAEQLSQLDVSYIFPLFRGRLEVGAELHYAEYDDDISSDTEANGWARWDYRF